MDGLFAYALFCINVQNLDVVGNLKGIEFLCRNLALRILKEKKNVINTTLLSENGQDDCLKQVRTTFSKLHVDRILILYLNR